MKFSETLSRQPFQGLCDAKAFQLQFPYTTTICGSKAVIIISERTVVIL
jgi:hypothetical protein